MKFLFSPRLYWWWGMLALGLSAYVLVVALSFGQSIWFDEGYSILLAKSPVAELLSLTAVDAHPPLYYLLLKLWGMIFGFSEGALRSLSALLLAGALVIAASLIRKLFSTKIALIALPFLLFAPFLLRYGYEIRMYSLATLIAVAATYVLVVAKERQSKRWWAGYAVLVAAGMYTLYLMIAVWLAHAVWLFVTSLRSKQRPVWRWRWWYALAGAVLLFTPYMPTFLFQLFNSALPGIGSQVTLTQFGNIFSTLFVYTPEWVVNGWVSLLLIAMIGFVSYLGVRVYRQLGNKQRQSFGLILALVGVPLLFFALSSLPPREPIFVVRYLAHIAIFIYILIGVVIGGAWTLQNVSRRWVVIVATIVTAATMLYGVVALALAGNFNVERQQLPQTQQVRSAAACDARTVVVADDPYTYIDSVFYFEDCAFFYYADQAPAYRGGYAPLSATDRRLSDSKKVDAQRLVHLRWVGQPSSFTVDDRYTLQSSQTFGKQIVDEYSLNAE